MVEQVETVGDESSGAAHARRAIHCGYPVFRRQIDGELQVPQYEAVGIENHTRIEAKARQNRLNLGGIIRGYSSVATETRLASSSIES